ncbi:MAG: MMPL family transporter [Candidatus Omnitrophica bacterium]|nr:MMPL family transporter [Candidatus Omnitrophota bacterium]MDD5351696.1 MMPL family transporter [Candidatus Omnitrophota bacterium]MDD5550906.1 MMPL family transporter [Candidatus Omnitrophota bacterium]
MKKIFGNFIHWFSHGLIRYRYGFLALCIIISLFFAYQLKNISFNTNLGDFYPLKHPYLQIQNKLTKIFGGLNQASIAIEIKEGDILNPVTLEKVWQITNELYSIKGINAGRVVSLSARKIKHVEANEEGFVTERLMHDPPQTQEGLDILRERIVRNPLVYGPIVSKDFKATLIQADFESDVSARDIFNTLQGFKKQFEDKNHNIYIAGQPVLQGWLDYYLPRMAGLSLITLIVMAFVLYNFFHCKRGVFLPLISAGMATLWGLGLMVMFGYKLTPSTILAPSLVFALGVSHSVQFIKRYYEYMSKHKMNSKAAAIHITHSLFVPAFTGLLTDGIGPFTLFIVPLEMVRSLALAIGFGILSIFFSTVILVPNLLSFMKPPKRLEILQEERATLTNKILGYFAKLAVNKTSRWIVIGSFLILTGVALIGMKQLEVGDKKPGTSLLYPRSSYNQAEKFISEKFSTADPYYIFIEGKDQDALLSSSALKEIDGLQRYLEKEVKGVGRTLSLVEYIKSMNMVMFAGKRNEFRIPDQDATIAEYLFLYSLTGFPGDFDPVVNYNYQYANIKVDLIDHKATTMNEVIKKTEEWIKSNHKEKNIEFEYAGGAIGMLAAVNQIVATMLTANSLFTSGLVFLCLVFAYGSLVSGWLLIIPLIFRTLLVFGILGFLKIGLTAEMIPMVALGIGFGDDFGIYIVSRLKDELKEGGGVSLQDALVKTMSSSGKAVFFTGLTLTIGIATWMFSDILMQAKLGALLAFFIFFNAIGTLVVIPSMIMTVKPKFLMK